MRRQRRATAIVLLALGAGVLSGPASADSSSDVKRRVLDASAALEDSTLAVRRAAASLAVVAAQLPVAQQAAAVAADELATARARLATATANEVQAQLDTQAAQARVDDATAKLAAGRLAVGQLARRSYQQGPLGDMRALITTASPQDLVDRVSMLEQVFKSSNDVLAALAAERLGLATATADLAARQAKLQQAQAEAAAGAAHAQQVAVRAQLAAAHVAALLDQRRRALREAEASRAADAKAYAQAQADSRALAERLRALARARAAAARHRHVSLARVATTGFLWPANGPLTSPFGWRMHPIFHVMRFHTGIDIGAAYGDPVQAAAAGTVVYAGPASGYGTLVLISHGTVNGQDLSTGYAHMSALLVSVGQTVGRGQQVGNVGNEGNSTGPHLHFEVRINGNPVDPLGWVTPP